MCSNPQKGLHCLKNDTQLSYLKEQTLELLRCLDAAISATETEAPVRINPYKLNGTPRTALDKSKGVKEKHWEESLWDYSRNPDNQPSVFWRSVTSFQVNLPNKKNDQNWGEVDLLGVSSSNLPVVIELKSNHGENLLRAILEASAYCIALRKAWSVLGSQWTTHLGMSQSSTAKVLSGCQFVIAAPVSYWQACIGQNGGKHTRNKSPEGFWQVLPELLFMLGQRGITAGAVALLNSGKIKDGLPEIIGIRTIDLITPCKSNAWLWNSEACGL